MTLTPERRRAARAMVALLDVVPDDMWVEIHDDELRFQGHTQENTRAIRALFPGALWKKAYEDACNWWTYTGVFHGVMLHIYAVSEAPPTCRRIVDKVEVEREVPVTFETRKVIEERVRWECGNGNGDAARESA